MDLWLWSKSQNFQKRPVPLSFSRTFQFWNPFLCSRLGNCANCPNSKKLTFGQILTKKSKFSRRTYLAQFFAMIPILGFISSFENPKLLKYYDSTTVALMWTLTKNQDVRAKLVLFRFSHRFWLRNPLFCFGLGNHLCDTLLRSTSNIQNLSSQD